jgi:hypothetical protein
LKSRAECDDLLKETLADLSSYYSELEFALVAESSAEEVAANGGCFQWQLSSGEVESYVRRADQLLVGIGNLQDALHWYVPFVEARLAL